MKKETSIISSIIFPKEIKKEVKINIILQLNMYLSSLRKFQEMVNIVLITNEEFLIKKIAKINNIEEKNYEIIFINNKILKCCNNEKGELFQYAFSKIDMLESIRYYLSTNKEIKKIIISDIDCLFLNVKKLLSFAFNVRTIAAINYRSEQFTDNRFDKLIKESIDNSFKNPKKYNKKISTNQMAWINSGFMIIKSDLAIKLPQYSTKLYLWLSKNKKRIKRECSNHYSDEIIFSAIFNFVKGTKINNKESKIARLIWTCNTEKATQNNFNPINYPAHLHLPSIKWENKNLKIISYLLQSSIYFPIPLIFLNIWSFENRLNRNIKKFIFTKILIKMFRMIENLIIKFHKKNSDLLEKELIKSIIV